ncbi:HAEPLYID family protein [Cyclobacterium xiamenense]|uniref:HAEPLYID family protein n=1 Tax=Cyclobacterium xiamenense TaxID=1297121 RepID=UPI00293BEEC2|nr:HAEPLYID family protein [Cyclobacterium xiamenense]
MMNRIALISYMLIGMYWRAYAQTESDSPKEMLDSMYISDIEDRENPAKVLHAEPLYIDLIRDLGARKGEKEWNVGLGLADRERYDEYLALVEYEWAPMDRLGLEVELPFSFYYPINGSESAPGSRLNSLKLAGQYSFFVSEKHKTSMAIGYIHEFELNQFSRYKEGRIFSGNAYNPFFIAAKRWGRNYHTLVYTGPFIQDHFDTSGLTVSWQVNTNFHYMISGTRNFIGIEFNKEVTNGVFTAVMRPQMRLGVAENLLVGIVTGIPLSRENERFSSFLRLIYEPGH